MITNESKQSDHLQRLAQLVPRTKKQRYLLQLSEDDFRDKIVRPVFLQQGYTDGRDTCGPLEQGKDCYFTKSSEIAGTDIFVVQTKVGKITKSSRARDNLDNLVAQLRTALSTSVPLVTDKKKRPPLAAYLVASGEINETAQQHILDQLSDPRLKFLDAETLIPLVDRHMPELWLDIDSDAIAYFRAICTGIERGSEMLSGGLAVAHNHTNACVLDDAYTQVHVLPARPKRDVKGQKRLKKAVLRKAATSFPATSLTHERARLLLVTGDGGSGKTTLLKRIAYELARREVDNPNKVIIPILLRARDLAEKTSVLLLDHVLQSVSVLNPALKQPFSLNDLTQGRVVFMIDGLDEVGTDERSDAVVQVLHQFHSLYPECQIIVTSRETQYTGSTGQLQAFARYRITPFSLSQAEKIIKCLAKQQSLSVDDSAEILRRLQEIHGIALSPLIVTIFAATSDMTKRDVPPNITELFKKYTELMLGRWDEGKKLHQQIQAPVKDLVLQQIAFGMHERRVTSIPVRDFKARVFRELESRGLFIEEMPKFYEEIVVRSGLFRVDSENIEFRHLLFQEFFAGRAIPSADYIKSRLEDDWWKRAVVFYFGENPNDIDSLHELARALPTLNNDEAFTAATTLGLALQACYFSHVEDKFDVYSSIIRSIIDARMSPGFGGKLSGLPIMLVTVCFFRARESLALSNLSLFTERIHESLLQIYENEPVKQEEARFWLITGLMECGLYDLANVYLERFRPRGESSRLLFPLQIAVFDAGSRRVLSQDGQKILRELSKIARTRFSDVAEALIREIEKELDQLDEVSNVQKASLGSSESAGAASGASGGGAS
jgi:energy-coupling factor transporter ATP-binding protein EcfA2